jgi:hypothetical protein
MQRLGGAIHSAALRNRSEAQKDQVLLAPKELFVAANLGM